MGTTSLGELLQAGRGVFFWSLAAAWLAQPAMAQHGPLSLRLESSVNWDANVFRRPDSAADPQLDRGIGGKSDRSSRTSFGVNFDKTWSQQRVVFDAGQTAVRYDKFSSLDRDAFNYRGLWEWHLTPRISGTLSADSAESVVGFDHALAVQQIVTVTRNRGFTADGWLFGGWHLLAGVSEFERKNSQVFLAIPGITQTSGEIGLRYVTASQNSVTFTQRSRRGTNSGQAVDFVNFIDSEFSVRESELAANWVMSGKSTLNGRLTRIERRNPNIPQRDFSATAGELRYAWTPTGKLTLNMSVQRKVSPFAQDTSVTYRVEDTLAFGPSWKVGEKTALRMNAYRRTSDFLGPVVAVAGPLRRDTLISAQLAADWTPHPKVTLSASVQRDRRSSTDAAFTFNDTITSINASLKF